MTGKYEVTNGDDPRGGEPIGYVRPAPDGMLHIKIDGHVTVAAAERIRIQIAAAINDVKDPRP